MKRILQATVLFLVSNTFSYGQCLTMTCPGNISTTNTSGQCGTVVNYSAPVVVDNCGSQSVTFAYTGAQQSFTVPNGVTTVTIEAWGAQGGANWVNNVNYGGYSKADFSVTPGEILNVWVGGQPNGITGGFNGGGNGEGAGQGGGGGSDVRQGGNTYSQRIIVGGGGGGAGYWSSLHVVGGVGGGMTGGDGYRDPSYSANPGGLGGTQTAGGANGTCVSFNNPVCAGGFGYGGAPSSCGCEGYGGGGGWYGGAGSGNCRGGGGGSGYILPIASNPTMTAGIRVGSGQVIISYSVANSTVVTQTAGLASGSFFPVGTTTNTYSVTDAMNNTTTCSFDVTVSENELPVITGMPSNITQSNDAGQCGANVSWSAPTATDNCSVSSFTPDHSIGSFFPIGNTTVTYSAADPSGNTATASFVVTVNDNELPALTCPAQIMANTDLNSCVATNVALGNATATDNCSVASTTNNAPSSFPVGTTMVTWTATDVNGNVSTCTQAVSVTDAIAPTISCPADVTVNVDANSCFATGVVLGTATATDNCTVASVADNGLTSYPVGNTTVTWTATDVNGNVSTCNQTVTVVDNINPTIANCPADITMCPGVVNFNTPSALDNCSATIAQTGGPTSGSNLVAGTYPVMFTATDPSGNTATCVFVITVNPSPTVTLSLTTPSTVCFDDANYTLGGGSPAGGVWSGNGVTGSSFDPSTAGNGSQTISYSYTDVNGCAATATDSIVVSPCTGIVENSNPLFSINPNPASDKVNFSFTEQGTLEIFDFSGKLIVSKKITENQFEQNTSTFANGVYSVRYSTVSGNTKISKLVVQH